MKKLPETENALLLRTDFGDDVEWTALCEAVRRPSTEGFRANLDCVSDPSCDGLTVDALVTLAAGAHDCFFVFVADHTTFSNPEHPILVVDVREHPGRTFRVIPREMWSVENNLSLANMDYEEFAENVDPDGVFRGFPPT